MSTTPDRPRMQLDLPSHYKYMQRQHEKGQTGISTPDLAAIVDAKNLIVASNWVGPDAVRSSRFNPYEVGKRIETVEAVLRLPHRMVVLTEPNQEGRYYLVEASFADSGATPYEDRSQWEASELRGLYIVGFQDPASADAKSLREYTQANRGRFTSIDSGYGFGFRHRIMQEVLTLHIDRRYPFGVEFASQKRVDFTAVEGDPTIRLIPVEDQQTMDLAAKIIKINTVQSPKASSLF